MSSVKRRIVIEEYVNGGWSISDWEGCEIMGISDKYEIISDLINHFLTRCEQLDKIKIKGKWTKVCKGYHPIRTKFNCVNCKEKIDE